MTSPSLPRTAALTLGAITAAGLLSACSGQAPGYDNALQQPAAPTVALQPMITVALEDQRLDLSRVRGAEMTAQGRLLLTTVADNFTGGTLIETIELPEIGTVAEPANTGENTLTDPIHSSRAFHIGGVDTDLDTQTPTIITGSPEQLRELAESSVDEVLSTWEEAEGKLTEEEIGILTDATEDNLRLAQIRARNGFGLTQLHETDGTPNAHSVWQMAAAGAIGTVNLGADDTADTHAGTKDPASLTQTLSGLEGSLGICGVAQPAIVDDAPVNDQGQPVPTEPNTQILDPNDPQVSGASTSTGYLLTSSGTAALVVRDPGTTQDYSLVEITLPAANQASESTDSTRDVLLGLGELDCVNSAVDSGVLTDSGVAIIGALDRDTAQVALDQRTSADLVSETFGETEPDTGAEETSVLPAPTDQDTVPTTAVLPPDHGYLSVVDGASGLVTALLTSKDMVAAHPELADKDVTSVAVVPGSYDHDGGRGRAGQRWWQRLLPGGPGNDRDTTPHGLQVWLTYEDSDLLYGATVA